MRRLTIIVSIITLVGLGIGVGSFLPRTAQAPTPNDIRTHQSPISGLVLPHHDLVRTERQHFLATAQAKIGDVDTLIVVSPNHEQVGGGHIQTTKEVWETSRGEFQPNTGVIDGLVGIGVTLEPKSFTREHGIRLILGDLRVTFPHASIVPLLLKQSTTTEEVVALRNQLLQTCTSCLLVASVDFSHYQPAQLAALHDDLSLRALSNRDIPILMNKAEVDAPAVLALLADWANQHETPRFHLEQHTNSGIITRNQDIETTTHVFGWYEQGEPTIPPATVSFLLGGDMMFGRMIAHTFPGAELPKSLTNLTERLFWGTDLGLINLEGPISPTPVPDDIRPNNLVFNFPPETIDALQFLRVNAVSLANNHSANAGKTGLIATNELLIGASIQPIGGPSESYVTQIGSISGEQLTLKIIGVHELSEQPDLTALIQELKLDPSVRVLVFPHWGAEYQERHGVQQEERAHSWIDAGADLVIGAHPHVIQDAEIYKNRLIVYSLGNLLFDQTFSKETQQGLLVGGEFTESGLRVFVLPVISENLQPHLARGALKQSLLDQFYDHVQSSVRSTDVGREIFIPY